jgi:hypothetical protein
MCTCLTISIPYVDFQSGGNDLYLTYTDCNGIVVSDSYLNLQYAIVRDGYSIAAEVYVCIQNSTNVTFKYGSGGSTVTLPNVVITQNGTCTTDEDCVPQCECLEVNIEQGDINNAINNTIYPNGFVFLFISGSSLCDSNNTTPDLNIEISNPGTYYYCTKKLSIPNDPNQITLYYYQNDIKVSLGNPSFLSDYTVPGTFCNEDIGCVPSSNISIGEDWTIFGDYKGLFIDGAGLYGYDLDSGFLTGKLPMAKVYNETQLLPPSVQYFSTYYFSHVRSSQKLYTTISECTNQKYILEFDIILDPWTIRFNRAILFNTSHFISGSFNQFLNLDIGLHGIQDGYIITWGWKSYNSPSVCQVEDERYMVKLDISGNSVLPIISFPLPTQNSCFNTGTSYRPTIQSTMITNVNQFIYTMSQDQDNNFGNICYIDTGVAIQNPTTTIPGAGGDIFPVITSSQWTGYLPGPLIFQKNSKVHFIDLFGRRSEWNPYLQKSIDEFITINPPSQDSSWQSVSTLQEFNYEDLLPEPIICGFGNTTPGFNYYYDCCGNFVEVLDGRPGSEIRYDYTKPSQGITPQYLSATTMCPTTSPTPTPTITPTVTPTASPTPTPTITPSPTRTPRVTPSSSPFVTLKNECDPFTLFDMGLKCNIEYVPTSTSSDGILSVLVTGGTTPYSFYWEGGQRTQRLTDVPQGSYEVTVVDFYGDYTATTICNLFPISPTPTSTPTPTPTSTPIPVYPNLCFIYQNPTIGTSIGPIEFVLNGTQNGKPTWSAYLGLTQLDIIWSIQNSRWEIPNWSSSVGIPVSNTTSNVPITGWFMAGESQVILTMTSGSCPSSTPLFNSVNKQDSTCILSSNGSITLTTNYGVSGYSYSIDGGDTYQSSNIFQNLSAGQYNIITKDSSVPPNTLNNQVVITNQIQNTNYTIGVVVENTVNVTSSTQICNWKVNVDPPLPSGITLSFGLNVNTTKNYFGPGSGIITGTTVVKKGNITLSPSTIGTPVTTINPRPNCSPYEVTGVTSVDTYQITIGSGESVSGTSTSILNITNNQVGANSCITRLTQSILMDTVSPTITGGVCYNIINQPQSQGINNHSITLSSQPNA